MTAREVGEPPREITNEMSYHTKTLEILNNIHPRGNPVNFSDLREIPKSSYDEVLLFERKNEVKLPPAVQEWYSYPLAIEWIIRNVTDTTDWLPSEFEIFRTDDGKRLVTFLGDDISVFHWCFEVESGPDPVVFFGTFDHGSFQPLEVPFSEFIRRIIFVGCAVGPSKYCGYCDRLLEECDGTCYWSCHS